MCCCFMLKRVKKKTYNTDFIEQNGQSKYTVVVEHIFFSKQK